MPRHQQVTTCRKSGGPVSKHCGCEHCTLTICSVCGGGEGSLTTDCPGVPVDADRHQEICETPLDYTDARGWHLAEAGHRRAPRFTHTVETPEPPSADPRALIAPKIDWAAIDRTANLQVELAKKAIAWVVADRTCEEHSATLTRTEDKIDDCLAAGDAPTDLKSELLAQLERERIDFQLSSRRAEVADDEFRQAARRLVTGLEAPLIQAARGLVAAVGERNRAVPPGFEGTFQGFQPKREP